MGEACAAGYCQGIGCADDDDCAVTAVCDVDVRRCIARPVPPTPSGIDIIAPSTLTLAPGATASVLISVQPDSATLTLGAAAEGIRLYLIDRELLIWVDATAAAGARQVVLTAQAGSLVTEVQVVIDVLREVRVSFRDQLGVPVSGIMTAVLNAAGQPGEPRVSGADGIARHFTTTAPYDLLIFTERPQLDTSADFFPILWRFDAIQEDEVRALALVKRSGYDLTLQAAASPSSAFDFAIHRFEAAGGSGSSSGSAAPFDVAFTYGLIPPSRLTGVFRIYETTSSVHRMGTLDVDLPMPARSALLDVGAVPMQVVASANYAVTFPDYGATTFEAQTSLTALSFGDDLRTLGGPDANLTPNAIDATITADVTLASELGPAMVIYAEVANIPRFVAVLSLTQANAVLTTQPRPQLLVAPPLAANVELTWDRAASGRSLLRLDFQDGLSFICLTPRESCVIPDVGAVAQAWAVPKGRSGQAFVTRVESTATVSDLLPFIHGASRVLVGGPPRQELSSDVLAISSAP